MREISTALRVAPYARSVPCFSTGQRIGPFSRLVLGSAEVGGREHIGGRVLLFARCRCIPYNTLSTSLPIRFVPVFPSAVPVYPASGLHTHATTARLSTAHRCRDYRLRVGANLANTLANALAGTLEIEEAQVPCELTQKP
eukprot:3941372-Rhodomonas_salina.2